MRILPRGVPRVFVLAFLIAATDPAAAVTRGPLRIDATNPRYFVDQRDRVVYLTGSHTWQNLKDRSLGDPPPPFDFDAYLDFLVAHDHNFIRLWSWEQPRSRNNNPDGLKRFFSPFPWLRSGPGLASDGKPRFDLAQHDPAYFTRLRSRVSAAQIRGIYVAVMLFNGYDLANAYNPSDGGFPLGSGNNINGVASDGPDSQSLVDPTVTALQEAYVRKVIDTVNDMDNVLYEIANETGSYGVAWQYHMIDVVKQYEATKPMQHPVGMTATYPGSDASVFDSDADWISPVSRTLESDGSKVVVNDTDHSYYWSALVSDGLAAQRAWAWTTLTLGAYPIFMDPYLEVWAGRNDPDGANVDPYWETLRNALGDTRRYAERIQLRYAVPSSSLCSTGRCLAIPGIQYLVFQPSSGSFSLTMVAGSYSYEWFDAGNRTVAETGSIDVASGPRTFTPPFSGQAVLLLPEPSRSAQLVVGAVVLLFGAWRVRPASSRAGVIEEGAPPPRPAS
jgi:Family of unknown function (DUF6298)